MVVWDKKTADEAIAAGPEERPGEQLLAARLDPRDQADRQDHRRSRLGMAPLGPPDPGPRLDARRTSATWPRIPSWSTSTSSKPRSAPGRAARRPAGKDGGRQEGRGEGRGAEQGRAGQAQVDRLRRRARAAVAANQPGLDPRQFGRLQPRARPDRDQRPRIQRDLDHRPQHHHGRGRRPHRRALGQGRRPALSLGQPARLPRRHQGRPEALRPAQRPLDSPAGSRARGTCSSSTTAGTGPTATIRRSTRLVPPVDAQGRYALEAGHGLRARRRPSGATRRRRSPTSTPSSSRAPTGCPTATR